ncbi:hypothetical protein F5Y15DRAFT_246673 [Xylariaceae sp. FL0016]|nr:hypothetical protein F5Y15DRAFT_246673 [Xylariaceae sp. FL0016]
MPPHSFCEWMLGQNFPPPKKPRGLRRRISFELLSDDDSDFVQLAVPRDDRTVALTKPMRVVKEPTKSAMRETPKIEPEVSADDEETDVEESRMPDEDPSSELEPEPDCPCSKCIEGRKKLKRLKQAKSKNKNPRKVKFDSTGEDTGDDDASDAVIHAQHVARKGGGNGKQANRDSSEKSKKANAGQKSLGQKSKTKGRTPATDTDSGLTEATATETELESGSEEESEDEPPKKKGKPKVQGHAKQGKRSKNVNEQENAEEEEDTSLSEAEFTKVVEKKGKKQKTKDEEETSASEPEPPQEVIKKGRKKAKANDKTNNKRKSHEKPEKSFPPAHLPPEMRQVQFLLPPRSQVLQVEHAVEGSEDPRPNAFYDHEGGIMRVFHGPVYGNPHGTLYPKRVYSHQNLPPGVPHPAQNPWYNGFATVAGQPVHSHVSPMASAYDNGTQYMHPHFQGYGVAAPGGGPTAEPANTKMGNQYDLSPSPPRKDREEGFRSNMTPYQSIEVTGYNGSPIQIPAGSRGSAQGKHGRGAQSALGPKRQPVKNGAAGPLEDIEHTVRKMIADDSAALQASRDRWSNRSGSKENSPQPPFPSYSNRGDSKDNSPQPAFPRGNNVHGRASGGSPLKGNGDGNTDAGDNGYRNLNVDGNVDGANDNNTSARDAGDDNGNNNNNNDDANNNNKDDNNWNAIGYNKDTDNNGIDWAASGGNGFTNSQTGGWNTSGFDSGMKADSTADGWNTGGAGNDDTNQRNNGAGSVRSHHSGSKHTARSNKQPDLLASPPMPGAWSPPPQSHHSGNSYKPASKISGGNIASGTGFAGSKAGSPSRRKQQKGNGWGGNDAAAGDEEGADHFSIVDGAEDWGGNDNSGNDVKDNVGGNDDFQQVDGNWNVNATDVAQDSSGYWNTPQGQRDLEEAPSIQWWWVFPLHCISRCVRIFNSGVSLTSLSTRLHGACRNVLSRIASPWIFATVVAIGVSGLALRAV